MAKSGSELSALPGAVRNQEIEESPLFSGFLPFEEALRVPCEFEKPHPLIHVGLVCGLVPLDLSEAASLLLSPGHRHPLVECSVDPPVQLVDIHRVKPTLQTLAFRLKPFDGGIMLALLIRMARMQRLSHPF